MFGQFRRNETYRFRLLLRQSTIARVPCRTRKKKHQNQSVGPTKRRRNAATAAAAASDSESCVCDANKNELNPWPNVHLIQIENEFYGIFISFHCICADCEDPHTYTLTSTALQVDCKYTQYTYIVFVRNKANTRHYIFIRDAHSGCRGNYYYLLHLFRPKRTESQYIERFCFHWNETQCTQPFPTSNQLHSMRPTGIYNQAFSSFIFRLHFMRSTHQMHLIVLTYIMHDIPWPRWKTCNVYAAAASIIYSCPVFGVHRMFGMWVLAFPWERRAHASPAATHTHTHTTSPFEHLCERRISNDILWPSHLLSFLNFLFAHSLPLSFIVI